MNVGQVAHIGLTPQEMIPIAKRYRDRKVNTSENIAFGIGVAVGIIVGIATCVLSIIAARYFNSFGHYEDRQFWDGVRQNWIGGCPEKVALCVMSAIFSPFLIGIAAGFATYGVIRAIGQGKVKKFCTLANEMHNRLDSAASMTGNELVKLMEQVDEVAERELLEKMNFDQIACVRETIGSKKLGLHLEHITARKEQHHLWLDLVKLDRLTPDEMVKKVKSFAFQRQVKLYPKLLPIVQDIIGPNEKYAEAKKFIFQSQFFHTLPTDAELQSKETIVLTCATMKPLTMNKTLLHKASDVIARKDGVTWKGEGFKIEEEEYAAFTLFAKGLEGKSFTKDEYLEAVPTFYKYNIQWERYLLANLPQFSEEEVEEILEHAPHSKVSLAFEERYLAQKLTIAKMQEFLPLTKKYEWVRLQEKCLEFVNKRLLATQDAHEMKMLLGLCREYLSQNAYQELETRYAALLHGPDLNVSNFRIRFEIAKENNWVDAANHLKIFCQNHSRELLDYGIWRVGEVPDDLVPILYA